MINSYKSFFFVKIKLNSLKINVSILIVMNRCQNYSWAQPNKKCRRKIFDKDKYFCDYHKPINFDELYMDGCPICSKKISITEMKVLHCNHIHHKECIERWLFINYTCPICRTGP